MKRLAVLSIFQLLFAAVVMAQAPIGSFYGFRLGMTISEVRSALSSQGKEMKSRSDNGNDYYVSNVRLGDCTFESLYLSFSGSKLISGEFYTGEMRMGYAYAPETPQSMQIFARMQTLSRECKISFNSMKSNFRNKYGSPIMDDDDEVVWRNGSKQIKLTYLWRDEITPMDSREVETYVRIKYETLGASQSNY